MTTATLKITERKSFTGALIASAIAVFTLFAIALSTPGCAFTKSVLGPALATCGTTEGLNASKQFNSIVAEALQGENFQEVLAALEADGETDAIQGVLCAVQEIAFSQASLGDAGIPTAPTANVFSMKYSPTQVLHARAYLTNHK